MTKGDLLAKKSLQAERQARVEQMRAAQRAKDRRTTILVAVAAGVVLVVLIGVVFVTLRNYREDHPDQVDQVGVEAGAASCDEIVTDPATGVNEHVGPGTNTPDVQKIDYDSVPPTHGQHFASPQVPSDAFYTADDRPAMETLVHNLEHGYTIIWYDEDLPAAQQDELKQISELARKRDETAQGKFIVSAWDSEYGELPDDKPVAISHWGVESGKRQLCGAVSGEVIDEFIVDNPYTDSPEPDAA